MLVSYAFRFISFSSSSKEWHFFTTPSKASNSSTSRRLDINLFISQSHTVLESFSHIVMHTY